MPWMEFIVWEEVLCLRIWVGVYRSDKRVHQCRLRIRQPLLSFPFYLQFNPWFAMPRIHSTMPLFIIRSSCSFLSLPPPNHVGRHWLLLFVLISSIPSTATKYGVLIDSTGPLLYHLLLDSKWIYHVVDDASPLIKYAKMAWPLYQSFRSINHGVLLFLHRQQFSRPPTYKQGCCHEHYHISLSSIGFCISHQMPCGK